jgi:hypothetical protein
MLPANLDDLTPEHIQGLIDSEVAEGLTLEYKEQLPTDSSDDKRKFLYRVSGMANAAGGEMVFGIVDKDGPDGQNTGIAEKLSGMKILNFQKAIEPLANWIRDGIAPRLFGIKMQMVSCRAGDVLVVRIPKSWNKPHMVTISQVNKFYIRTAIGSSPMNIDEIRRAFFEQGELRETITHWREQRVNLVASGNGPLRLSAGTIVMFHVIPVDAFTPGVFRSVWRIAAEEKDRIRIPGRSFGYSRYNADGFLRHSLEHNRVGTQTVDAYTQLFRSGIAEYCFCHEYTPEWAITDQTALLRGQTLEQELVSCYENALSRLIVESQSGAVFIGFSLIGIAGKVIFTTQFGSNGKEREIRQNLFSSPEVYVDLSEPAEERPFERTLLPLIDTLWQVGGLEGTPFKTEEGKWNPFGRYQ